MSVEVTVMVMEQRPLVGSGVNKNSYQFKGSSTTKRGEIHLMEDADFECKKETPKATKAA